MPSALLVQLRQLHPLEVSDSNPMPSALLVQLRQLHPLEVSGNPTLLRTKKGLKAPYRPTQSGAIQSFQPIKNGRPTEEHLLLYQYSAHYFFNPALMLLPLPLSLLLHYRVDLHELLAHIQVEVDSVERHSPQVGACGRELTIRLHIL